MSLHQHLPTKAPVSHTAESLFVTLEKKATIVVCKLPFPGCLQRLNVLARNGNRHCKTDVSLVNKPSAAEHRWRGHQKKKFRHVFTPGLMGDECFSFLSPHTDTHEHNRTGPRSPCRSAERFDCRRSQQSEQTASIFCLATGCTNVYKAPRC